MNPSEEIKEANASCGCTACVMPGDRLTTRRLLWLWGPVAAWAGFIVIATSLPAPYLPPQPFQYFDLIEHGSVYGMLGFLLHRAVYKGTRFGPAGLAWGVAFFGAALFGVCDETHQLFIPSRYFAWSDMGADVLGVALGTMAYALWRRLSNRLAGQSGIGC